MNIAIFFKLIVFVIFCSLKVAKAQTTYSGYEVKADEIFITDDHIIIKSNLELKDKEFDGYYKASKGFLTKDIVSLEEVELKLKNAQAKAKIIQGKKDHYYLGKKITATLCKTCDKGKSHNPLWQIRAEEFYTDLYNKGEIQFKDVYFDILGRQVFRLPWVSVPAFWTTGRTGFLLPTIQYGAISGLEMALPFYWMPIKNFDVTIIPRISKKAVYDLKIRQKFSKGGYEISMLAGSLQSKGVQSGVFESGLFQGSGNFFTGHYKDNSNFSRGSEFGARGEIAFGDRLSWTRRDGSNPYKPLVAEFYYTKITSNSLLEGKFLQLQDTTTNRKQLILPKIDLINFKKIFEGRATLVQSLAIDNLYNDFFKTRSLNLLFENKILIKKNFSGHHILYQPKLVTSFNNDKKLIDPRLTIEWRYKNLDKIIPQIGLNLATKGYASDELSDIYTVNNTIQARAYWSLFTKDLRSITRPSKAYLDYGATLYSNTLGSISLFRRDYLDKEYYKALKIFPSKGDNYFVEMNISDKNLFIQNKSWFTNDLKLSNNELYFRKAFQRFKAGFNYFFFDKELHFIKQKMENHLIKTQLKYKVTEEVTFSFKNSFLMNKGEALNAINYKYNKFELKFKNDCAEIAFAVKQQMAQTREESPESIYQIHFKIPQLA